MTVIVTSTRPSLLGLQPHEELFVDGASYTRSDEGHLHVLTDRDDHLAVFAPGTWLSARVVGEIETRQRKRIAELEEQLEQARAEAIDAAEDVVGTPVWYRLRPVNGQGRDPWVDFCVVDPDDEHEAMLRLYTSRAAWQSQGCPPELEITIRTHMDEVDQ